MKVRDYLSFCHVTGNLVKDTLPDGFKIKNSLQGKIKLEVQNFFDPKIYSSWI